MNPKYQKVLSDIEKAEKKKSEIEVSSRSCTTRRQSWKTLKSSIPCALW